MKVASYIILFSLLFLFASCGGSNSTCRGKNSAFCLALGSAVSLGLVPSSDTVTSSNGTSSSGASGSSGSSSTTSGSDTGSTGSSSTSTGSQTTSTGINCSNLSNVTTANVVYGQGGVYDTNTVNKGGISENSLNGPFSVAVDSAGNVFISDTANQRILMYPPNSTTATRVYGQSNFNTNTNGTSSTKLKNQIGIHIDSSDNLYVADLNNSRVLFFPKDSTTATRVYGQSNFTSGSPAAVSSTSMNQPRFMITDSSNNLYVSDGSNARVLFFPVGTTTATRVYGQAGDLSTNTANKNGISADSLNSSVEGLALDSNGNLYVSDQQNRRILYFAAGSTTATRVYGQGGVYDTNTVNKGGRSAVSLGNTFQIAIDRCDNLLVADNSNYRVLVYPSGSTTATKVYGQNGSFTTANTSIAADTFGAIAGLALDNRPGGKLYVTDYSYHRVLVFPYY